MENKRYKIFKTTFTKLYFLLAFGISSCAQTHVTNKNSSLTIAMSYDPISLDPRSVYLAKDISIAKALYEGLTRETSSGIQLALADSYTLSTDKRTYTFTLKSTSWSNGDPLTAYDFEESIKQLYTNSAIPAVHTLLNTLENSQEISNNKLPIEKLGIYAKDETTLEISLEKPITYFLEILAHPTFYPVHKSLREYYKNSKKSFLNVSNGPFILKKYQPQNSLILEKNTRYYDFHSVYLETITFKVVTDPRTALKLLQNQTIDLIGAPWSSAIIKEAQKKLPQEKVHTYPVFGTTMLIYNFAKPLLQNKALRKALAYAIDKEALLQFVNLGKPAHSLIPPGLSQLPAPTFLSLEERHTKARQYFEEAKKELSDKQLAELYLLYPVEANNFSAIAQNIQQQIKKVLGLHIPIQGTEYHCFLEQRKHGDFFIATGGWIAEYQNPMTFLAILGDPHDLTKWKNHDYETFLKIQKELGGSENTKLAETLIDQEMPIIPLYHCDYIYATNLQIKNIFHSPLGYVDFKEAQIIKNPLQ
ncbi:peptide ABC transporter substrate-binding protein [Chlamydia sp. 17-3921]|uniref:peptide ABC transporter substrate-binding protein n=1 Tax=Chlamydia sp. 17-3921 TaxID=2675798 RepID=UPI00191A9AFE|nr:peptide ABC transporter substrate-binding protein [Chlamydia sp. 17-3921]